MLTYKTINYRGGIARFDIPANWVEEYKPEGGATFYEDRPDSGTLRLHVLGFRSNGNETGKEMVNSLIKNSGYAKHRDGLVIKEHQKTVEEGGEQLHIKYWEIGVPVDGCSVRLVTFSYTILTSQSQVSEFIQEIEMLGHNIRTGEYSREQGVGGSCQHE